jgi:hypothetical protein
MTSANADCRRYRTRQAGIIPLFEDTSRRAFGASVAEGRADKWRQRTIPDGCGMPRPSHSAPACRQDTVPVIPYGAAARLAPVAFGAVIRYPLGRRGVVCLVVSAVDGDVGGDNADAS